VSKDGNFSNFVICFIKTVGAIRK